MSKFRYSFLALCILFFQPLTIWAQDTPPAKKTPATPPPSQPQAPSTPKTETPKQSTAATKPTATKKPKGMALNIREVIPSAKLLYADISGQNVDAKTDILVASDPEDSSNECLIEILSLQGGVVLGSTKNCRFRDKLTSGQSVYLQLKKDRIYPSYRSFAGFHYGLGSYSAKSGSDNLEGSLTRLGLLTHMDLSSFFRLFLSIEHGENAVPNTTINSETLRSATQTSLFIATGPWRFSMWSSAGLSIQPLLGLGMISNVLKGEQTGGSFDHSSFGLGPLIGLQFHFSKFFTLIDVSYRMALLATQMTEVRGATTNSFDSPSLSQIDITLNTRPLPWDFLSLYAFFKINSASGNTIRGASGSAAVDTSLSETQYGLGLSYSWDAWSSDSNNKN